MTSPARRSLPFGHRPGSGKPGGGLQPQGLAPLPDKRPGPGVWAARVAVILLALLTLTWLLGRTVDPIRVRLAELPVVGEALFGRDVWPILWNRPTAPGEAAVDSGTASGGQEQGAGVSSPSGGGAMEMAPTRLADLEAEIAARLASVELRESEVRRKEAELREREQVLIEQEARLREVIQETEALRTRLEGQLRTELDRVQVVRGMKRSAVVELFAAMTDDEVIAVLRHMQPDEAGRILSEMDPYRAARILQKMTASVP